MVDATLWFTIGAVGMAVGTLVQAAGSRLLTRPVPRRYWLLVAVPGIATVAYGLLALSLGGLTAGSGGTIFLPRYADWLLTTPLHVLFVGLLVDAPRPIIYRTMGLQAATIVLGFVAGLLGGLPAVVLYLAGCGAFLGVIYYVFTDFAVAARAQPDGIEGLFRRLRSFMIVLWLIYPVIWLLTPTSTGLMDVETTALVVTYLDLVAKVGFGLIALNGQLATGDTTRAETAQPDARHADV